MEGAWLARARWRRRGAWLWPAFVAAVLFDGASVHALPIIGDQQSFFGGLLAGLIGNVLAVLLFTAPIAILIRRRRPDLPKVVARDYAGTLAVITISALILAGGLLHRSTIIRQQNALRDAIVRAEAFIGTHAPPQFRANATHTNTFTIQSGAVYRTCAPGRDQASRYYCVIVKIGLPLARSVVYSGSEPNATLSTGAD